MPITKGSPEWDELIKGRSVHDLLYNAVDDIWQSTFDLFLASEQAEGDTKELLKDFLNTIESGIREVCEKTNTDLPGDLLPPS